MLTALQKRCVEISYRRKLTHVSSALNAVNVIDEVYQKKKQSDPFVLGNSHAALALFVVLEKYGFCDAESMSEEYGTHARRDMEHGVWVSGGSLGQAETIAVGMAIANPQNIVFLVTSDGACMEGAVWESMRIARTMQLTNLHVQVVCNGYGAYSRINENDVNTATLHMAIIREVPAWEYPKWLRGLPGHYLTLNQEQYEELMQ